MVKNMKKKSTLKVIIASMIIAPFSCLKVSAGSANVSGANFNVTATATHSYISCSVTGPASNGASATVYGWAAGAFNPKHVGARTGNPYVNWYISTVSGYSSWAYCYGTGYLSTGQTITTANAYA